MKEPKPKTCKQCKNKFVPTRPLQSVCSMECAVSLSGNKVRVELKKKARDDKKKAIEKLTNWGQRLVVKIQEIARLIDNGQPCLARGVMAKQFHGGHVYSKGSNPQMKYNLHNIHRQSAQSNHFGNDDGALREGLAKEYGADYMEFVASLRAMQSHKIKNDECLEFYKKACKVSARLKKDLKPFSKSQRLLMRNDINMEIGIYPEQYSIFTL